MRFSTTMPVPAQTSARNLATMSALTLFRMLSTPARALMLAGTLSAPARSLMLALTLTLTFVAVNPAAAQNWIDITPGTGAAPVARAFSSAVFDTQDRRMIVFGGESASGRLNDVWAFDLDTQQWTDLTPASGSAPALRRTPVSVYDPVGHRMITWSGQGATNGFFNDVWEFDLTTNTWSEFAPTGGPPNIRYGAAGVLDPVAGDLVTFAGFTNQGRFDDVWRFGAGTVTWTDASPVVNPLERCLHSASYDSREHRMIMYGGQNAGARDDIWALDLSTDTWEELTPVSGPPGRWFAAHVYDAGNHRVTVFGGYAGATAVSNEVWVFDLWTESWTQLLPLATPPSAREGSAGIYDADNDRMVLFGGHDGTPDNEVWVLDNLSGTVTHAAAPAPCAAATLHQNHPNPFNPSTAIRYEIAGPANVKIRVFDARGALVRTLADAPRIAGPHTAVWDGRDDRGVRVSSGVYFYRLDAGRFTSTKKMVLLK